MLTWMMGSQPVSLLHVVPDHIVYGR